jgi:matrix metalloproteinase-14 (membrane-inserted)
MQSTTSTDDDNPLCRDGSIDAAVSLKDGDTYVFKYSQYWKLTDESVAPGYPRSIAKVS